MPCIEYYNIILKNNLSQKSYLSEFMCSDFRAIQIVEPVGTSLVVTQTLYLKLSDSDFNVPSVSLKCQEQLDSEEAMVMTDSKGQELLDSSGTQGGLRFNY